MEQRIYGAIDLKSFYASVECMERGLDPMTTNLVVADPSRTEKTICLAVSPSLKAFGVPGRPRLFEVVERIGQVNALRRQGRRAGNRSWDALALANDPHLEVDYIVAPPQMAKYMQYSARIYEVYLKYVAPEDIHVYSIDEVFMDLTPYLRAAGTDAEGFVRRIIRDVLETTGITATAGLGTNLYLCKVAMDIVAKKPSRTNTVCGWLIWMKWVTAGFCGPIDPLRIFGGWAEAMPDGWKSWDFTPWEMWLAALWARTGSITMPAFFIKPSVSTQSC